VLEDAERLIGAWNESQANRMPMLFSPTALPPHTVAARYMRPIHTTPHNALPLNMRATQQSRRENVENRRLCLSPQTMQALGRA